MIKSLHKTNSNSIVEAVAKQLQLTRKSTTLKVYMSESRHRVVIRSMLPFTIMDLL
ncbi:MAG: hypothetical protein HZB59_00745 [Ignavibacteriales bacterium]|nr:hypothetical protein [Ignavibacteriales bacterium]